MRLDKALTLLYPDKTRSFISKNIKQGQVQVNGKIIKKASFLVNEQDKITADFQEILSPQNLEPQKIPLEIIFENEDFLVINKQKGIAVHPGAGNKDQTIVNALLYYYQNNLSYFKDSVRPGIVHRLDKDTSGVLIVAKNNAFHNYLAQEIAERRVEKVYRALVVGKMEDGLIQGKIGRSFSDRKKMSIKKEGKEAVTKFRVIKYFPEYEVSLVEIFLITGRTHQIRVHFQAINHPVVGDCVYGNKKVNKFFIDNFQVKTQLLHACRYSFFDENNKKYEFEAEVKDDLLKEDFFV